MSGRGRKLCALAAALCALPLAACNYYVVGDRDYSGVAFTDPGLDAATILADTKQFVYGDREIAIGPETTADAGILDRTAFTSGVDGTPGRGERAAALRLVEMLAAAGFTRRESAAPAPGEPYVEVRSFTRTVKQSTGLFSSTTREVASQNVVAEIPATGEDYGTVIVGTHYDNRYGSDLIPGAGGHGVYSGGLGVGVLVTLARAAVKTARPYTLRFVAFGAGEAGNVGSSEYVAAMTAAQKKETMLMFGLDLLGGGDYLYLFCDDAETAHEDYLRAACDRVAPIVRRPPKDKRVILSNGSTETYTHYGYFGDQHAFYRAGIACAALFGLNWEAAGRYGLVESATRDAVLGTADDTLYGVMTRYPDYLDKTTAAANLVMSVLNAPAPEFAEVMRFSRETRRAVEWLTDTRTQMYIYGGAVLCLALVAGVAAGLLARRQPTPADRIELPQEDIFRSDDDRGDGNPFAGY